jgi:hypothetical protein
VITKCRSRTIRILSLFAFCLILWGLGYSQTNLDSIAPAKPAYRNLPLEEGYFSGAENVRLSYRGVGKGSRTIVFLHGSQV